MKYKVIMWHGYNITLFDDLIKLVGCTTSDAGREDLYYEGTLDDFAKRWKKPMLVHPSRGAEPFICVTQYGEFVPR